MSGFGKCVFWRALRGFISATIIRKVFSFHFFLTFPWSRALLFRSRARNGLPHCLRRLPGAWLGEALGLGFGLRLGVEGSGLGFFTVPLLVVFSVHSNMYE